MQLGLVTYMWGAEWDLPTVIKNCEAAGFKGVELRTQHKHGVEPKLTKDERKEVAKRNHVLGQPVLLRDNKNNDPKGELTIGTLVHPFSHDFDSSCQSIIVCSCTD